ncbi:MAG: DUF1194 domain-containing protein [Paracoccaceae bacterium]
MSGALLRACVAAAALGLGAAEACETALVLAIDVSGSVDAAEYRLQMDGLTAALRDPNVRDALVAAEAMIAVMQWSGANKQEFTTSWTHVVSHEIADRLAGAVEAAPRAFQHFSTAIGDALAAAAVALGEVSGRCKRHVVDISGDGVSNEGRDLPRIRDALIRGGVQINGLAIEIGEEGLSEYYRREVIGGGGAFVLTARSFEDYPRAIRRKLLRELADPVVRLAPAIRLADGGR